MKRAIERLVLVLLMLSSVSATAIADQAIVNATLCEPIADGVTIKLVPAEDSSLNLEIGDMLEILLAHAGFRLAEKADFDLRYQARKQALRGPVQDRTIGRLGGGSGGVAFNLKLWSTTKDSVLGGRQPARPGSFETYLVVTMQLDRYDDGACIWHGEAGASLVHWRDGELAARLARLLVDAFGKGVSLQTMELE